MAVDSNTAISKHVIHAAENRLRDSSHLFLRHVECDFHQGQLLLNGKVPSFYLKQLAQTLLQDVQGVERIDNRLAVVNPHGVSSDPHAVTQA